MSETRHRQMITEEELAEVCRTACNEIATRLPASPDKIPEEIYWEEMCKALAQRLNTEPFIFNGLTYKNDFADLARDGGKLEWDRAFKIASNCIKEIKGL